MPLGRQSVIKVFPTLYKKTSTGAIQFWKMEVSEVYTDITATPVGELRTIYGQDGTASPQETRDIISEDPGIDDWHTWHWRSEALGPRTLRPARH